MRRLKMKLRWVLAVTAAFTLTACGSDQMENEDVLQEIDPPQEIEFINEEEDLDVEVVNGEDIGESTSDMDADGIADEEEEVQEEKGGPVDDTVMRELYLVDSHGYVAPQTFSISRGNNEIENLLQYLVHGGPITEMIPSGFQAILPSGTEILN